jgi:hypothetical protein
MKPFTDLGEAVAGGYSRIHSASSGEVRSGTPAPALVTLHSAGRGKFTATLGGYPLVARACSSIIFAACRALTAAGVSDGPARFRHNHSTHPFDATVRSIHASAKLVALDRQRSGLCIEAWTHSDEE